MCFSASASFTASAGLAVAGTITWRYATSQQKFIAAIPVLFAVQQAIEGLQWLFVTNGAISSGAGYAYLFFAYLLWPTYVPLAVYFADPRRQWLMKWFLIAGAAVTAYFIIALASQPLEILVRQNSLCYSFDNLLPFGPFFVAFYLIVTCGPLLLSSQTYLRWLGLVVAIGAAIAAIYFSATYASVWCYFAAVSSAALAFLLWRDKNIKKSGRTTR